MLHEVAHHFLGYEHVQVGGGPDLNHFSNMGPMYFANNAFGTADDNRLTIRQLAEIQKQLETVVARKGLYLSYSHNTARTKDLFLRP